MDIRQCVEERRLGEFLVSNLDTPFSADQVEQLMPVFAEMFVVDARYESWRSATRYIAYGPRFEPVQEGWEVPQYHIIMRAEVDEETGDMIHLFDSLEPVQPLNA